MLSQTMHDMRVRGITVFLKLACFFYVLCTGKLVLLDGSFWDDWMRQPAQRLDRACIRPEVPRTSTFGKVGVSKSVTFV